ncbi:hypothetical protein [Rhodococcus artemisiae]|uniref:Uncharacterized protein n=1 Tax=Rhodococcus artemisiae TaxID=714159 RepID=A0ABU7LFN6_9NOCA|nr:hypothetical protein [Rhodococcus artemisiae]MEE2060348.1 hypothetical protein [Rhodococcus artemisiae]
MTEQRDRDDLPRGAVDAELWNGIGNEFAGVHFRKVSTRNGERLELYAPRTESRILLDPMALEVLADQQPEFFTHLIATRLGSVDD